MQAKTLAAAVAVALGWQGIALGATDVEQRLLDMEARARQLEQRIQAKEQRITELEQKSSEGPASSGGWLQDVQVSGLVETEAFHQGPYEGDATSDVVLATAALGISAQVHDWVASEISFRYEEGETDLEVDEALVGIAPPGGPWRVRAGQFYLPFGVFESGMVSDPLTLEIAETRESALEAGITVGGATGAAYVFNGDNSEGGEDHIDNWGATLGYEASTGALGFKGALGYLNDIGESDGIPDSLSTSMLQDQVPAWTASAVVESGPLRLVGEYLAATDSFRGPHWRLAGWTFDRAATPALALEWTRDPAELGFGRGGAQPKAWNLELGYAFKLVGKDASFAVGYQGTEEALALELPERRLLSTLSVDLLEHATLSFEWAHDDDYGQDEGGSGESADTVTAQLAVEF